MKQLFLFFAFISFSAVAMSQSKYVGKEKVIDPFNYRITKTATYQNAAVATAHPLASEVGVQILKRGGNAFDAAIAVQFALAVVYPQAGNIGGGGFLMARTAAGKQVAIDYRETAPAKAYRDMYLDKDGKPVEGLSVNGHLASGVPGMVAGLAATAAYGKMPWKDLVDPAISLAQYGFAITKEEAANLNAIRQDLLKYNTMPTAFTKDRKWMEGDVLIQAELSETLKRIRDYGAKGFYEGKTARLLTEEMQRGGGIISAKDLKAYKAKHRKPVVFSYRGYEVISFPPPSSGGILLGQMLKMAEPFPLQSYGHNSAKAVHLLTEIERRAYADRAEYMGDPDFYKVPEKELLSAKYLTGRMKTFDPLKASVSKEMQHGNVYESDQTTHLSIADKAGNMVAVTTTLNTSYGSKVVVGGAGFFMNNEMDDLSIKPGVPNVYGAVGREANAIAPGKRMLSSMTPTLVLKNKKPFMVVGTPGGTTIPTSVLQSIVNVIDFRMLPREAIDAPKFHHQWLPDRIDVEKSFPKFVVSELEKKGHTVNQRGQIGRVEMILFEKRGLNTAADSRGDDSVAGY